MSSAKKRKIWRKAIDVDLFLSLGGRQRVKTLKAGVSPRSAPSSIKHTFCCRTGINPGGLFLLQRHSFSARQRMWTELVAVFWVFFQELNFQFMLLHALLNLPLERSEGRCLIGAGQSLAAWKMRISGGGSGSGGGVRGWGCELMIQIEFHSSK